MRDGAGWGGAQTSAGGLSENQSPGTGGRESRVYQDEAPQKNPNTQKREAVLKTNVLRQA